MTTSNYVEHPDQLGSACNRTTEWAYYEWLARQEAAEEQQYSEADDNADRNSEGEPK